MEPLNTKERTSAIWKMIGLFTFTFFILIWGIYFDTRAPEYELKRLREEAIQLKDEAKKVDSVVNILASVNREYNLNPNNIDLFVAEINTHLIEIKRGKDDTLQVAGRLRSRLYENVMNLQSLAKKNGEQSKELEETGDCPDKLKELNDQINTLQGQLDNFRNSQ